MSPGAKTALAVTGVAIGAAAAYAFFNRSSKGDSASAGTMPNTADQGGASVGHSPGSGTRDWWHDRNDRKRKKHMKMMTAKG